MIKIYEEKGYFPVALDEHRLERRLPILDRMR
jgi:hypothetical protein